MKSRIAGTKAGFFVVVSVALAWICSPVGADVLYLKDGSRVVGSVKQSGNMVYVDTAFGKHTIQAGDVDHVEWGVPAVRGKSGEPSAGAPQEKKAELRRTLLGAKDVLNALEKTVEIDFVDTPLPDVIGFFQNITNVNFVLDYKSIPEGVEPVTIRLKGVKMKVALKEILSPLNMDYEVRDNVIRIASKSKIQNYVLRVYDVRDLLLDFADRSSSSTNLTLASQSTTNNSSSLSGTSSNDSSNNGNNGDGGGEEITSRALSLALLITTTVRPETWEANGARLVGGPSNSEGNTEQGMYGASGTSGRGFVGTMR